MITATFRKVTDCYIGYSVVGHACFAPVGQDIVCAAVSSLYWAITTSLEHEAEEYSEFINIKNPNYKIDLVVDCLFKGLSEIARQFPNHVEVIVRQEGFEPNNDNMCPVTTDALNLNYYEN